MNSTRWSLLRPLKRVVSARREMREMSDLAAKKWGSPARPRRSGPIGQLKGMPISMDMSMAGKELAGAADTAH